MIVALLSACGGIQKARYYQPTTTVQNTFNKEWGDGVATADQGVCVWVGDATAMYLTMMAGPIGLPVFPLGVLAGKIDRLGYFDLSVWVVPESEEQKALFRFDPTTTYLEFENGVTKQPQTIQVSRFKTYWVKNSERISYPEHWGAKSIADYKEPIELWDWSRFTMRFEKPDKDIGPLRVRIEGISSKSGENRIYEFTFREVTKYRYLISGHNANGEWGIVDEATPCRELFKEIKK